MGQADWLLFIPRARIQSLAFSPLQRTDLTIEAQRAVQFTSEINDWTYSSKDCPTAKMPLGRGNSLTVRRVSSRMTVPEPCVPSYRVVFSWLQARATSWQPSTAGLDSF